MSLVITHSDEESFLISYKEYMQLVVQAPSAL